MRDRLPLMACHCSSEASHDAPLPDKDRERVMGAPRATEAAMRRALSVWQDAGLPVGRMEVTPEGRIIITAPEVDKPAASAQGKGPKQWSKIG